MRFDLRDPMHYDFFIAQAKQAGQEIENMLVRLGQSRALKARKGYYAGGNIPAGYLVDFDPKSPTFERFLPYLPHAEIIIILFDLGVECNGSIVEVIRACRDRDIFFPSFAPGTSDKMRSRTGLRFCRQRLGASGELLGYEINRGMLYSIFTNPAYIGHPIRSGEVLEEGVYPAIVDEDVFMAVYSSIGNETPKRRGKIANTEPHLLQGLLFSNCLRGEIRPVYFSSSSVINAKGHTGTQGSFKCACGEAYPEIGACFHINLRVIIDPVRDHVLSQIAFPEYVEEVRKVIQDDFSRAKTKADSYKRERVRLQNEIENLRANFRRGILDDDMLKEIQGDIRLRESQLKALEDRELAAYSDKTIAPEDVERITGFLNNLKSEWDHIPVVFQSRLFRLLLSKVVIIPLDDGNFHVDIRWATGFVQRLWIERPTVSSQCKEWSAEEKNLLRRVYPAQSIREVLDSFPEKNWDSIRSVAKRLGVVRTAEMSCPWTDDDIAVLKEFCSYRITYRQARFELRHHRQKDIAPKVRKLGLEMPETDRLNWRVVGNIDENVAYSPG